MSNGNSRWWLQIFFFHPYLGKIPHFDSYSSNGLKPPTRNWMGFWIFLDDWCAVFF